MQYQNFDLRIEGKPGEPYRVRVECEGRDPIDGLLDLSPECQQIVDKLHEVETLEEGSSLPMDLGLLLYGCLFRDDVRDEMLMRFGEVFRDAEKGMRIRLMLSPAELATLPWEVLCDPKTKSYLATSGKTPLIRHIASREPINSLRVESPVRMLVIIPSGSGLDVAKEEEIITKAVREQGSIELRIIKENVTRYEITKALNQKQYHILHFIGHGQFKSDQAYLEIDKDESHNGLILADDFAAFFKDYPSLKLAVLNCCQGGQLSPKDKYAGMAAQLVKLGIPAVVAMQYRVSDDVALVFAREFYLKLCDGWARGQVDMAVSHARHQILRQVKDEPIAFATPVLFLRSDNSIIFDVPEVSDAPLRKRWLNLFHPGALMKEFVSLLRSEPARNRDRLALVKQTRQKNIEAWEEKSKEGDEQTRLQALEAIAEERAELQELDRRIVRWNRAIPASLLATFLMFLAGYAGLFNVVHADDWLATRFIPYMDEFIAKKFSPNVRLILADDGENGGLGNPREKWQEWRTHHVKLIDKLTQAGAKAIVFDLRFDRSDAADTEIAAAIARARTQGTRVILAKGLDQYGNIGPGGELTPVLDAVAGDEWGNIEVGGVNYGSLVRIYQLGQLDRWRAENDSTQRPVIPSLALLAAAAFLANDSKLQISYDENNQQIQLKSNGQIIRPIPVYENIHSDYDFPFNLAERSGKPADASPRLVPEELSGATDRYVDILNQTDPEYLKQRYASTVVLIGYKEPYELFSVLGAERRYGTEIHANVISNILTGTYVRLLPTAYDLLIVSIMVGLGVLVRARFANVFAATVVIPFTDPRKRFDVPGLLIVVDIVYLLVAFLLYKNALIFMLKTYHLVAPFIAYWLTGKLRGGARLRTSTRTDL